MTLVGARKVHDSFRRSLHSYSEEASPQQRIARLLVRRLLRVCPERRFRSLFEFGCGTGHLTVPLTEALEIGHRTLNDLVAEVAQDVPVPFDAFIAGPVETVAWPADVDLIASASALQWLESPDTLMKRLADHLVPQGWLALSSFGPEQFTELQALGSGAGAPGYTTPEQMKTALDADVHLTDVGGATFKLWFDTPTDVLRHLRRTGVNGRASGRWTRRDLERFSANYTERFSVDGRVPLTYHPVWAIGQKP